MGRILFGWLMLLLLVLAVGCSLRGRVKLCNETWIEADAEDLRADETP